MTTLLVLPILVPLLTAVGCLACQGSPRGRFVVSSVGSLLAAGVSLRLLVRVLADGPVALAVGGWQPPFAISLVADPFSAMLLLLPGVLGPLILLHALLAGEENSTQPAVPFVAHTLFFGVAGAFLAGDVFNLYVWFEVLLISSFVLVGLGARRRDMVGAIHYVVPNLLCSAVLLAAIGLIYGLAGTLDLATLRLELAGAPREWVGPIAALFLVAFGIKAALVPFSGWLPHAYPSVPPWVAALFSALLTKVGLYSLIRVFTLVFPRDEAWSSGLLMALALLTMVLGVLGAAAQVDQRRILAFHSVSQVGYVVFGLAIGTPLAVAGAIVFLLHHALVKANLFLSCGLVRRLTGSYRLGEAGGLWKRSGVVSTVFGISAMSLAGIPPLSGFVAKLALVMAALQAGHIAEAVVALGVSLVTTFSMSKIWGEAFWKEAPGTSDVGADLGWREVVVPCVLAMVIVAVGLGGGAVFAAAEQAAAGLLDPTPYVRVVTGGRS